MRYLPVKMKLDPRESINNMGNVRVDVLDASDLPAGDRNGYSDPYCKFVLNGKEVFKSSEQKRTLTPVWRQYFEVPVPSRIGADFKVLVYDWDAVGNDDLLGSANVDLTLLEPLRPREYKLPLDGKSGMVRLRMLFRPDYVTRARQGSSTFSGTLAPSKAMTTVANAPIRGVTRGASFFKDSFKSLRGESKSSDPAETSAVAAAVAAAAAKRLTMDPSRQILVDPSKQAPPVANGEVPSVTSSPVPAAPTQPHGRSTSFGGRSVTSVAVGKPGVVGAGGPDMGTATFTILGAQEYPPDAKVRVQIKQLTPKGPKDIHKSKSIQATAGQVQYENETCKVQCTPDTQFQIVVKDHAGFRNLGLGEAMVFVDDSTVGSERTLRAGTGSVTLRTSFVPFDATAKGAAHNVFGRDHSQVSAESNSGNGSATGSGSGSRLRNSVLGRASVAPS